MVGGSAATPLNAVKACPRSSSAGTKVPLVHVTVPRRTPEMGPREKKSDQSAVNPLTSCRARPPGAPVRCLWDRDSFSSRTVCEQR